MSKRSEAVPEMRQVTAATRIVNGKLPVGTIFPGDPRIPWKVSSEGGKTVGLYDQG